MAHSWFDVNVLYGGENVSDSAKSINDFPVEASIPDSTVSLESILCTNELRRRQSRPPDYKKENNALVALLSALDGPDTGGMVGPGRTGRGTVEGDRNRPT